MLNPKEPQHPAGNPQVATQAQSSAAGPQPTAPSADKPKEEAKQAKAEPKPQPQKRHPSKFNLYTKYCAIECKSTSVALFHCWFGRCSYNMSRKFLKFFFFSSKNSLNKVFAVENSRYLYRL